MINTALADPQRALSDQLIVAVFNIAIVEAVFGSKEEYHIHMQGIMRMLGLRGGLATLTYDGYIEQVIEWYDVNCSHIVGCERYLAKTFPMLPEPLPPNKANFSVGAFKEKD